MDKSGKPYYLHPIAVFRNLSKDEEPEVKHAALLHDIIEDTNYTSDDLLKMGYTQAIVDIVELVSRDKSTGQTYIEWIRSIASSGNIGAIKVKEADLKHNLSRMGNLEKDVAEGMTKRYNRALKILLR